MIFPKRLKKGDRVGIIAPSSPVSKEDADLCKKLVEDMGYPVKMGKGVYQSIHGYAAGTGQQRAQDINEMFADEEIRAIWCIRGGHSSAHVMDKIDYALVRRNPKIFVGYSDVTNLNVAFNQRCQLVTFHGPMVKPNMLYAYDEFTKESFEKAMNMKEKLILTNPPGKDFQVMVEGHAQGIITGGNIALLTSMIGTPYEIDTKDKILFMEEVGESICRLDRMMHQLKYAGKLEEAKGIILGSFTHCTNPVDKSYGVMDLLKNILKNYEKPVMYNIQSGHCFPMSTIPLGARCIMDTKAKSIVFTK